LIGFGVFKAINQEKDKEYDLGTVKITPQALITPIDLYKEVVRSGVEKMCAIIFTSCFLDQICEISEQQDIFPFTGIGTFRFVKKERWKGDDLKDIKEESQKILSILEKIADSHVKEKYLLKLKESKSAHKKKSPFRLGRELERFSKLYEMPFQKNRQHLLKIKFFLSISSIAKKEKATLKKFNILYNCSFENDIMPGSFDQLESDFVPLTMLLKKYNLYDRLIKRLNKKIVNIQVKLIRNV